MKFFSNEVVIIGVAGAVIKNIEAAKALAQMVQTSLGPNGMNKLVVNHLEKIIVTSDSATIVKELEIQHPAAKMLVLAAEMQESEYGDNTNFVSYTLSNPKPDTILNDTSIKRILYLDRSFHLLESC